MVKPMFVSIIKPNITHIINIKPNIVYIINNYLLFIDFVSHVINNI